MKIRQSTDLKAHLKTCILDMCTGYCVSLFLWLDPIKSINFESADVKQSKVDISDHSADDSDVHDTSALSDSSMDSTPKRGPVKQKRSAPKHSHRVHKQIGRKPHSKMPN